MIVLNLLPAEQVHHLEDHAQFLRVARSIVLVVCMLLLIVGVLVAAQYMLEQRRDELQREIDGQTVTANQPSVRPLDLRITEVNNALTKFNAIQDEHQTWSPLVFEITALIPVEMQLRSLTISAIDRRVDVSGISPTRDTFLAFITALESSSAFTDISYPLSLLTEQSNLNFAIRATLTDEGIARIHP